MKEFCTIIEKGETIPKIINDYFNPFEPFWGRLTGDSQEPGYTIHQHNHIQASPSDGIGGDIGNPESHSRANLNLQHEQSKFDYFDAIETNLFASVLVLCLLYYN